jgi:hypothetical protein
MPRGAEHKHPRAGRRGVYGRRATPAAAIRWGVIGFIFGATGWSLVGFWDVAANRLLAPAPEPVPGCTALLIDPVTGQTKAEPCAADPA